MTNLFPSAICRHGVNSANKFLNLILCLFCVVTVHIIGSPLGRSTEGKEKTDSVVISFSVVESTNVNVNGVYEPKIQHALTSSVRKHDNIKYKNQNEILNSKTPNQGYTSC